MATRRPLVVLDSGQVGELPVGDDVGGASGALGSLSDVVLTTPADGYVLTYQSSSGTWIDAAPTGGSGTTDHAALSSNLAWTTSGHTGTASRLAGWDGSNVATTYVIGTGAGQVAAGDHTHSTYALLASGNTFAEAQTITKTLQVGYAAAKGYESFLIVHSASYGGGYFVQKEGGARFVAMSGFDAGASGKILYVGGGGWGVADANEVRVYTAPTVTSSADTGVLRLTITAAGSIVPGAGAIATNATDGMGYMPSCAGTPTGTPTTHTGRTPYVFDSTNGLFYVYTGSAWVAGGTVRGPASATDNAVVRYDGITGKLVQDSAVTIADTTGAITAGAYNKVTVTAPASAATLTLADGSTLATSGAYSITLTATGATTVTLPTTGTLATTAQLHDAVTVTDSDTIDLTLSTQALSAAARVQMSITSDASGLKLSGDSSSPGNSKLYGTDGSGTKGWYDQPSGTGAVATDTIWDAKGDLAVGTGSNTASRLAAGTNGYVLTADSGEATGLKWAAAAGGGAPTDADYLVKTANGSLSAERVVTDTATVAWDWGTAGQAKANVPDGSISLAKMADLDQDKIIGRATASTGVPEAITCTAAGRALLDDASATAQRATLATADWLPMLTPGGRLGLVSAQPLYDPSVQTPASTDTGSSAETVTLNAGHGWVTGLQIVSPSTTGGLTAGTIYWVNVSTNTVSFHTTLADALAGTNKVNLTANVTQVLYPVGMQSSTLNYTPHLSDKIALYDGSAWICRTFSETSLSLTLTNGKNYDIFAYDNSGTLALELSNAWTSDTARADALTTQDGVLVKSGATTRRYLGTIRAAATNVTESSTLKRFVWNLYNREPLRLFRFEPTDNWAYQSVTVRYANNNSANKVEVLSGLPAAAHLNLTAYGMGAASGLGYFSSGIGEDDDGSPTYSPEIINYQGGGVATVLTPLAALLSKKVALGYHYYTWRERSNDTVNVTFYALFSSVRRGGLMGTILG